MNKKITLSLLLILGVSLAACSWRTVLPDIFLSPLTSSLSTSSLPTASPTETPLPSHDVDNLFGSASCINLFEFEANLGQHVCIDAKILATENWGNDYVMWLDQDPSTRYIVVRNTFYLGAEGACMRIMGIVQKDASGRFFIRADDPGQVEPCTR